MGIGSIGSVATEAIRAAGAITPTAPTRSMADAAAGLEANPTSGIAFGEYLRDAIGEVNALQQASTQMTDDFIMGRTDSIHEVMIAAEKASLSLQLTLEIRNKVLEAYQEINRMQI